MRKKLFALIIVLFAFVAIPVFAADDSSNVTAISTPIVRVSLNGSNQVITQQTLDSAVEYYSAQGYQVSSDEILQDLIYNTLIEMAVYSESNYPSEEELNSLGNYLLNYQLSYIAASYGVEFENQEEWDNFILENTGYSLEEYANMLLMDYLPDYLLEKYINQNYQKVFETYAVTDEMVEEIFAEQYPDGYTSGPYVRLAHIFFNLAGSDKATKLADANKVYTSLKLDTVSFEEAAKNSDDESHLEDAGVLSGYYDSYYLSNMFGISETSIETVLSTEVGKITKPIEGANGYHIFKVLEYIPQETVGLDGIQDLNVPEATVRESLKNYLAEQYQGYAFQMAYNQMCSDLLEAATIKKLK